MADSQPFKAEVIYDSIALEDGGMDSNLNPLLLPKNQLAFASNMTVRGGFMTDRPPFTNRLTITWPSTSVQTAFEQGLFQGSAFYKPDSGNESLFAAVGGRLYQFVVNGNNITVYDRTISGDPNPATATQAWLWQSENFLIWNDGLSLPVFFDGSSSRRSYGPSVLLNTANAALPTSVPDIGQQVVLTLTSNYTGQYNVPILFHGAFYQAIENSSGYQVSLTNITDTPTTVYPAGTNVVIRNDIFGVQATTVANAITGNTYAANTLNLTLTLTLDFTGSIGDGVILFGKIFTVTSISGVFVLVRNSQSVTIPAGDLFTAGQVFIKSSVTSPNVIIGSIADSTTFTAPTVGLAAVATLTLTYSGTPDQAVFIGDKQYTVVAVPSGAPGTSLTLINLNDTAGVAYAFPADGDILSVPELPAGRMGAYGLGQNWVCLVDGLSFIASDQSRGPSGTYAYNFRDAVLKTADLTFRGGNFAIPGAGNAISSMTFTTNLDVALGQGSLQVGTPAFMASCQAPIDYTNPPTNGPILTFSLIGFGPLGQDNTISVNSDIYFRSTYGAGTLVLARRDFDKPGNLPISAEMERVIVLDEESLLSYGSAAVFDNRYLLTVSPQASSQGVLHAGMISLNLDTLSSLRNKSQPCWDGLWTGVNVLKLVTGIFGGVSRLFAFTFNVLLSKIELYEMLPTGDDHYDNENIPITWTFETGALFNKDTKDAGQLISLRDGEFAVDDLTGTVRFEAYYKADQGCWTPWNAFSICASEDSAPQHYPRLGLGEPDPDVCDPVLKTPNRDGYTFQVKFVITGHCRFLRLKLAAVTLPDPKFQPPTCDRIIEVEV